MIVIRTLIPSKNVQVSADIYLAKNSPPSTVIKPSVVFKMSGDDKIGQQISLADKPVPQ